MDYTIRKPTVGDMRAIYALDVPENEVPFKIAERCILVDGQPIGEARLNEMNCDDFEMLMAEINATKKNSRPLKEISTRSQAI